MRDCKVETFEVKVHLHIKARITLNITSNCTILVHRDFLCQILGIRNYNIFFFNMQEAIQTFLVSFLLDLFAFKDPQKQTLELPQIHSQSF